MIVVDVVTLTVVTLELKCNDSPNPHKWIIAHLSPLVGRTFASGSQLLQQRLRVLQVARVKSLTSKTVVYQALH